MVDKCEHVKDWLLHLLLLAASTVTALQPLHGKRLRRYAEVCWGSPQVERRGCLPSQYKPDWLPALVTRTLAVGRSSCPSCAPTSPSSFFSICKVETMINQAQSREWHTVVTCYFLKLLHKGICFRNLRITVALRLAKQSHSDITILAESVCTVFPHCPSLRIPNLHGLEFSICMVWPSNIPNNQYTTHLLAWNVSQTYSLGLTFIDVQEAWPGTFVLSSESVLGSPERSYDLNENVTTNSISSCVNQILM